MATNNPFATGSQPGGKSAFGGGFKPPAGFGMPPMGVGRGNFPPTQFLERRPTMFQAQGAGANRPDEVARPMGVGEGNFPGSVPASAMSPDQQALMNSQQMFAANQAKLQAGQANQAALNQTATAANTAQVAQNSQTFQNTGQNNGQNMANATAQMPAASAEMQTRARMQAAQPGEGAGPGNPTYSNNNQPGQQSGLISGQMQNRRVI